MTIGLGSGRAVFALVDLLATAAGRPCELLTALQDRARARAAGSKLVGPERRPPPRPGRRRRR